MENVQDVLNSFSDLFAAGTPKQLLTPARPPLEKEEEELLRLLPVEEISLEKMEQLTKLPIRKLNILLMSLILKRVIKDIPRQNL